MIPGAGRRTLLFFLAIVALIFVAWWQVDRVNASGHGQIDYEIDWENVQCVFNYGNEDVAPPSCEGWVLVYEKVLDLGNNVCEWMPGYFYNCETGEKMDIPTEMTDPNVYAVEGACAPPQPSPPCGGLVWNNGVTWISEGQDSTCSRWEWRLYVSASLPCNELGISPYPASLVGWPTAFKFLGANPVSAQAALAFAGAGSLGDPQPGDQRNIVLRLDLKPAMDAVEVYIPRWGRVVEGGKWCPEQGPQWIPASHVATLACWDLPSHPAAGGEDQAGNYFRDDPVAADTPLFKGWGRVPYYAYWSLYYEQYQQVDTQEVCVPPAEYVYDEDKGQYVPECTYGEDEQPGHIEEIPVYDWVSHQSGGIIDPDWVAGIPDWAKADLNGDGDPEAFWSYAIRVIRLGEEPNYPVNSPWYKEYVCRPFIPMVVREAQSRVAWPEGGRVQP